MSCTLNNKNMKKVFFIIGLGFLITSCGLQKTATTINNQGVKVTYDKTMVYYDSDGFCYPTLENIQQYHDRVNQTGEERKIWCHCEWRTKQECEVLDSIAYEEAWKKMFEKYEKEYGYDTTTTGN